MAIISKHKIKLLKLFLVSPMLEKIFLLVYVVTVPLLALTNKFNNSFSQYYLAQQFMHIINADKVNSLTTVSDIADWLTDDLVPAYFTDKITINKPLFPIFLLKTGIKCDEATFSAFSPECSLTTSNLQSNIAESQIIKNVKGHYGVYPISEYLTIPRDISSSGLTTLNTNLKTTWLNTYGTFLSVEIICYNDWNKAYLQLVISLEWNAPEQIIARNIAYDISSPGNSDEAWFVIFYSFFIIQLIVFMMKVLFEFSISPNRYTFAGHVCHFTVQTIYALIVGITLQQDKLTTTYTDSFSAYIDIETSIKNMTFSSMLLSLVLIFYPLRLFTLLSWNKYLATPIKLFVILYRTLPGIIVFGLGFITLWVCFSLASFLGLREFVFQVQSYPSSLLNYFSLDYGKVAASDAILNSSKKTPFQIVWSIHSIAMGGLLLVAIAVIVDLVKRSFDHEVPAESPHQIELQDKQMELYTKFDKFLKELSSIFGLKNKDSRNASSFSSEEKMVIWLEHKMGQESEGDDVIEQLSLSKDPPKIMVFYKPEEVEEFLKYLFRLKPNLLTSQAGSKFRIVYETKFEKVNTEKNNIETLLDWLKGVGCRVPFLLFTKAELERETYIHIKKKYPALFVTEDKSGALKFCRMEGKLDNFGFKLENNENKYIGLENSVSDISVGMTSRTSID